MKIAINLKDQKVSQPYKPTDTKVYFGEKHESDSYTVARKIVESDTKFEVVLAPGGE